MIGSLCSLTYWFLVGNEGIKAFYNPYIVYSSVSYEAPVS